MCNETNVSTLGGRRPADHGGGDQWKLPCTSGRRNPRRRRGSDRGGNAYGDRDADRRRRAGDHFAHLRPDSGAAAGSDHAGAGDGRRVGRRALGSDARQLGLGRRRLGAAAVQQRLLDAGVLATSGGAVRLGKRPLGRGESGGNRQQAGGGAARVSRGRPRGAGNDGGDDVAARALGVARDMGLDPRGVRRISCADRDMGSWAVGARGAGVAVGAGALAGVGRALVRQLGLVVSELI